MNDIKVFGKRNKNETYVDRIGAYIIAEKDGCFAAVETPRGFFLSAAVLKITRAVLTA